jgi:anti-sigma B factor antagonist
MSLKVKVRKKGGFVIVGIEGSVSGTDVPRLQHKLDEAAKSEGDRIAVDLSETTFIDSHGLGMLIFEWKQLQAGKQDLTLICPAGFIRDILVNSNLQKIVRVVETEEGL